MDLEIDFPIDLSINSDWYFVENFLINSYDWMFEDLDVSLFICFVLLLLGISLFHMNCKFFFIAPLLFLWWKS